MAKAKPSAFVDTRVIYCGDNLDQLRKLPDACVDLITIAPPFNSNRNCEYASPARTFWGETKEKRGFEDRPRFTGTQHSPTSIRVLTVLGAAGAKANFLQ